MLERSGFQRTKEEVKASRREMGCHSFDGFSYSSIEINYSTEACMVAGLMAHAVDKSSIGLERLGEISGRAETLQDKHRNVSDKCIHIYSLPLVTLRSQKRMGMALSSSYK